MYDELYTKLNEATFDTIRRKHRSIKRLFPDFDVKTRGVERMGGLKLVNQDKNRWMFRVHSGTEDDLWYDDVILFKDVANTLKKVVMNRRLWSKSKDKADMRQVTHEFMKRVEVEVKCTCPAFLYWGSAYILSLSKYQAKYTSDNPETRPPKIRNPKKYGAVCKHLDRVLKVMAFYATTMTKWLKEFHGEDIDRWEKVALAHTAMFKDLGQELAKKKQQVAEPAKDTEVPDDRGAEEEPPEEPIEAPEGDDSTAEDEVDPKVRAAHDAMDAKMRAEDEVDPKVRAAHDAMDAKMRGKDKKK